MNRKLSAYLMITVSVAVICTQIAQADTAKGGPRRANNRLPGLSEVHIVQGPRPSISARVIGSDTSLTVGRVGTRHDVEIAERVLGKKTGSGHFVLNPNGTVAANHSASSIGAGSAYRYPLPREAVQEYRPLIRQLVNELARQVANDHALPYSERKQFPPGGKRPPREYEDRSYGLGRLLADLPYERAFPNAPRAQASPRVESLGKRTLADVLKFIARRLRGKKPPLTEQVLFIHYLGQGGQRTEGYDLLYDDLYRTLLALEGVRIINRTDGAYEHVTGGPGWNVSAPPSPTRVGIIPGDNWEIAMRSIRGF